MIITGLGSAFQMGKEVCDDCLPEQWMNYVLPVHVIK